MFSRGRCKVADLGLAVTHSNFCVDDVASLEQRMDSRQRAEGQQELTWAGKKGGTPHYMSPRVIAEYLNATGLPPLPAAGEGTGVSSLATRWTPRDAAAAAAAPPAGERRSGSGRRQWTTVMEVEKAGEVDGESSAVDAEAAAAAAAAQEQALNRPTSGGSRPLCIFHAADAFAFGVIMYECLALRLPWEGRLVRDVWARVQNRERPRVTADDERAAPAGYVQLMREMWAHDPRVRPTFKETLARLKRISRPVIEFGQQASASHVEFSSSPW